MNEHLKSSKQVGKLAEELVDYSFNRYDMWWSATWPEVVFIAKGKARATGRALPDRIALYRGQLLVMEIKTWRAKDRYSLRKRLHQFDCMTEMAKHGATCFYLVLWRWDDLEWRLYPVGSLEEEDGRIEFVREEGKLVGGEVPDWLGVVDESVH